MRTTLVLSEAAYEVARSLAHSQHRTMGEVVSEMILRPSATGDRLSGPNALGFYTFASPYPLTVESVKDLLSDE